MADVRLQRHFKLRIVQTPFCGLTGSEHIQYTESLMRQELPRRLALLLSFPVISLLLLPLVGCQPDETPQLPDRIRVISPDPQYGIAGSNGTKRVSVEVQSAQLPGLLGGKGVRHPLAGERLLIRSLSPESGLTASITTGLTDPGGRLDFDVELGHSFGDQYLEVSAASKPSVKQQLRFVSGVQLANQRQEVMAGETTPTPFRVTLLSPDSSPLVGVPVYFTLLSQPGTGGKLLPGMGISDEHGVVEVDLQTSPDTLGVYQVSAEIAAPQAGHSARPLLMEAAAMHIATLLTGVLGGLALFVFGITLMSEGLQQVAGNRLRRILSYITGNHVRAVCAGAMVTGLIQSSSSTTVMTIGFVNAGLLTLKQAIGVIFGANIGTTASGQIVSFDLGNIALPAITLGVLLLFALRRPAGQGLARAILGFGLLFFGMGLMSTQLKTVSTFPSFIRIFQAIDCSPAVLGGELPVGAMLAAIGIGVLTTTIVQSSAATIGLAIALANSGLLNIWTAVPIILGDNIGTTITANLASLSANRTAKQAAIAHTLFNVLGVSVMVALFNVRIDGIPSFIYAVDHLTAGDVFAGENVGRHVAASHTLFNVVCVFMFTPFINVLAWLCTKIIPEHAATPRLPLLKLDKNWLTSPAVAIDGALRATAAMSERACWVAFTALDAYRHDTPAMLGDIETAENETDEMQRQIMDYLMQLTRCKLSASQTAAIPALMHCVADAERIADIGVAIAELSRQAADGEALTTTAQQELDKIIKHTKELGDSVLKGLSGTGKYAIETAVRLEGKVKILCQLASQGHVVRLQRGECTIARGIIYVEVLALVEAVVRHLGNIATRTDAAIGQP